MTVCPEKVYEITTKEGNWAGSEGRGRRHWVFWGRTCGKMLFMKTPVAWILLMPAARR